MDKKFILKDSHEFIMRKRKKFIKYYDESLMGFLIGDWTTYSKVKPTYISTFQTLESGEIAWHIYDKDFNGLSSCWTSMETLLKYSSTKEITE